MQGGGKPYEADAKAFGNAMGQIAHGQAMMAAIRDYTVSLRGDGNRPVAAG
jgi:guanyl-specific ribonuclease Sa